MKLRSLLRILIPVCALGAVSCTNEELILDASQTQRGREFAQAFQARFGEIDPNHTWVDGTVGKVTVTTDEKANVVIYALGFNGGKTLKLKELVVDGTRDVKYDIPLGAKTIVARAFNEHGSVIESLSPNNEGDHVDLLFNSGTRTVSSELSGLTARERVPIPNVWNHYGRVAPWATNIPSNATPQNIYGEWNFFYGDWNIYHDGKDCIPLSGLPGETEAAKLEWLMNDTGLDASEVTKETIDGVECFTYAPYGKRSSWWGSTDTFGTYYLTNLDENAQTLRDADYYRANLNMDVIAELNSLLAADENTKKLAEYCQDAGFKTTAPGPVSISWIFTMTSTRDYVGYYYTTSENDPEEVRNAPKYLLMDASYNDATTERKIGDTFPLTYYGEDGNGSPTFEFPANVYIHFFICHGNGSTANEPNPDSGFDTWAPGETADWLFKHTYPSTNASEANASEEWVLNIYHEYFSSGGNITDEDCMFYPSIMRLYEDHKKPDSWITTGTDTHEANVYYPSVAFNYAGYNVISFEDWPYIGMLDWNDCAFVLNGNFDIDEYSNETLAFSLCMEDLGGTDDLDYNDIWMIVQQGKETMTSTSSGTTVVYGAPKVIIPQAGGTLDLAVSYEDPNGDHLNQMIFEHVHDAFGENLRDVAINTCDPQLCPADKAIHTVNFSDGATVKCINGLDEVVYTMTGFTPEDNAQFSVIEHAAHFQVMVTYDDGSSAYLHIPNKNEQTVDKEADREAIPFAFMIPQSTTSYNPNDDSNFIPAYERQFLGDKYTKFPSWVAAQDASNQKWYQWHWNNDAGTAIDPTNYEHGESKGSIGQIDNTSTTHYRKATIPASQIVTTSIWSNPAINVAPSNILSTAKKIKVTVNFTENVSGRIYLGIKEKTVGSVGVGSDVAGTTENFNNQTSCSITATGDWSAFNTNFNVAVEYGFGITFWSSVDISKVSEVIVESWDSNE